MFMVLIVFVSTNKMFSPATKTVHKIYHCITLGSMNHGWEVGDFWYHHVDHYSLVKLVLIFDLFLYRYQFFLQVKQDILQERLLVVFELAAELGAYIVQCKLKEKAFLFDFVVF